MDYDFTPIANEDPYLLLPEGVYLCRVAETRTGTARDGSERWSLRLEVVGGEHAGRTAAWDNLTWSERGVHRIKHVLEALGFDASGPLSVEPEELVGLQALVTLQVETYQGPTGDRRRMTVPYLGYAGAAEESGSEQGRPEAVTDGSSMPF